MSSIAVSEVWSNNLISECQKWCSGTQYLGKKDETDSIEPSYKEGLHMSAFYLVTKSTTTKVHHEYLIYDFIGTYITIILLYYISVLNITLKI